MKFYNEKKKITKKLVIDSIKTELAINGQNWYDYHSDHMCYQTELEMSVDDQYSAAKLIAEKMFPDFFVLTDFMKENGCKKISCNY